MSNTPHTTADFIPLPKPVVAERDLSKPAEQQGLFRKFHVLRVDGSDRVGEKHFDCRNYVLDLTHDEHAPAAMRAYAASCQATHPQLAADIVAEFGEPMPASEAQTDLAKRLLEMANKTGGHHSAVSLLKSELIAICCEANRYYDGMLAWKRTAEKKDADWNAERMDRVKERCAARADTTAAPGEAKPFYFTARQAEILRDGLRLVQYNPRRHEDIATAERMARYLAQPSGHSATAAPVPASEAAPAKTINTENIN